MLDRGARAVFLNRAGLTEAERAGADGAGAGAAGEAGAAGGDTREVAGRVLLGHIERYRSPLPWLRGESGRAVALDLLDTLKTERGESRTDDHTEMIIMDSLSKLDVEGRASGATRDGDGEWTSDAPPSEGKSGDGGRGAGGPTGPSGLDKWLGGGGE